MHALDDDNAHLFVHPFHSLSYEEERYKQRNRSTGSSTEQQEAWRSDTTQGLARAASRGHGRSLDLHSHCSPERTRTAEFTDLPVCLPIGVRVGATGDLVFLVLEPLPRVVPPPAQPGPGAPRRRPRRGRPREGAAPGGGPR